jgi:hypothetical protein
VSELPTWSGPLVVVAILVPTLGGFVLAGPALGLPMGTLVAAAAVYLAVRYEPKRTIRSAAAADAGRHVLVALSRPVEGTEAVERIALAVGGEEGGELLVLAPAHTGFLDRWASDVGPARDEAQRKLVISVASLAAAHLDPRAQVGDADLVQAVEDALQTFPATEVILATGPDREDPHGARAAQELESRLEVPFERLLLD